MWETSEPYQSVVQVTTSDAVTIRGLVVRHYSKSVANNYAVFVQVGGGARPGRVSHWGQALRLH